MFSLILSSAQLTLTDRSFDETLRQYPVAMVAFVTPWCGRRCMELEPALQRLAVAWHETGIAIARASAETCSELLDRFEIVALPALLWFDGSKAWPHYASEAKPERYNGPQTYDALLDLLAYDLVDVDRRHTVISIWVWEALLERDVLALTHSVFTIISKRTGRVVRWWPTARM